MRLTQRASGGGPAEWGGQKDASLKNLGAAEKKLATRGGYLVGQQAEKGWYLMADLAQKAW
jgi:hypothetical protein